ncbi:MAG: hypothetical protein RIR11_1625 [Bacteroidota bacterium]|jgi:hypothetical protein
MKEDPKRLAPSLEIARELYLKSGNQCAFYGCTNLIMDSDGNYIGELCHIESAMSGGERFNPDQSNEDRRAFSNLMLMCHKHHVITNNTDLWTVEKMQKLKKEHESKFSNIADKIIAQFTDFTKLISIEYSNNLYLINEVLKWGNEPYMLQETLLDINTFANELSKIPLKTRSILSIILERSTARGSDMQFSPVEIEEACHIDSNEVKRHLSILDSYHMIGERGYDDFGQSLLYLRDIVEWPLWKTIKEFCSKTHIPISSIVSDLKFNNFDK